MKSTLLLIRHGETDWNKNKTFRGIYDVPLNENGRSQANLLRAVLKDLDIRAIYSSPLKRAVETAKIACGNLNIEINIEEGLIDFNYGDWTGIDEETVSQRWPEEYNQWRNNPHLARPPLGTTLQELSERAFPVMEDIARRHQGATAVIFAHRVVNKVLTLKTLGLGLDRFNYILQDNCCLNIFDRVGRGYILKLLNDTCHLKRAGVDLLVEDF